MVNALNTMPDGTCRTIKAQYFKNGYKNICENGEYGIGGTFACTGVIEIDEDSDE